VPSFKYCPILQDVFATTLMNFGKFATWTNFNKLTLATSIEPQSTTIWTINVFHYFPTHFKSVKILIHLIFTFQRTFKPFIFKKIVILWNSRFGGAKEVPGKQLKIFQFGNHQHEI